MDEMTAEELEELIGKVDKSIEALEVLDNYLDIDLERTKPNDKPIMLVRNKRYNTAWLIHITEEEYEKLKAIKG